MDVPAGLTHFDLPSLYLLPFPFLNHPLLYKFNLKNKTKTKQNKTKQNKTKQKTVS